MNRARRVIWVPSLLVGAAVATAVATGAGVLLYDSQGLAREIMNPEREGSPVALLLDDSEGLVRAAAVLIGVAVLSLATGLRMGRAGDEDQAVRTAVRWWVGLLVALLAGSGFTGVWELMDGFAATSVTQGLGLAVTGALPAYFAGGVWGRLGRFAASLGAGKQVLIGAVAGVAGGAALVLVLLGRPVLAVTAFLGAAVFASGGARCQGWIFDRVPRRRVVLHETTRPGLLFEAWHTAVPETEVRVLWDGGRERMSIRPRRETGDSAWPARWTEPVRCCSWVPGAGLHGRKGAGGGCMSRTPTRGRWRRRASSSNRSRSRSLPCLRGRATRWSWTGRPRGRG